MNIHISPYSIEKGAMVSPFAIHEVATTLANTRHALSAFRQVAGMTNPTDRVSASAIAISRQIVAQADAIRAQPAPAAPPAPAPARLTRDVLEKCRREDIAREQAGLLQIVPIDMDADEFEPLTVEIVDEHAPLPAFLRDDPEYA